MKLRIRRISVVGMFLVGVVAWLVINPESHENILTFIKDTGAEVVGVGSDEFDDKRMEHG